MHGPMLFAGNGAKTVFKDLLQRKYYNMFNDKLQNFSLYQFE